MLAADDIRVRTLDHPDWVLEWSPVFVTFEVVNDGQEPALIDVGSQSVTVAVGTSPTALWEETGELRGTGPSDAVWLRPDERWLLQREIGARLKEPVSVLRVDRNQRIRKMHSNDCVVVASTKLLD